MQASSDTHLQTGAYVSVYHFHIKILSHQNLTKDGEKCLESKVTFPLRENEPQQTNNNNNVPLETRKLELKGINVR